MFVLLDTVRMTIKWWIRCVKPFTILYLQQSHNNWKQEEV